MYRTVRKFNEHGNILNRNKGNSGRKITQRRENNIAIVQLAITENPTISVRRNETNLSKSTFHRILNKDIGLHPYKMQIKHELQPNVSSSSITNWRSVSRTERKRWNIIRKTVRSMVDRSNTCLERNEGHVEGY